MKASGNLNKWKWLGVDGLNEFAGPKIRSAGWDRFVDFKGKTVGVIGTGSAAIEVVPQLQKQEIETVHALTDLD